MEHLSRSCGDRGRRQCRRLDHVVGVTAKEVQQSSRSCSRRLAEPHSACDVDLERRTETILGTTDEEMQMTPHEPHEIACLDKRRFNQRCGSARGERAGRERTLQIA
jgi:hypothetical protein